MGCRSRQKLAIKQIGTNCITEPDHVIGHTNRLKFGNGVSNRVKGQFSSPGLKGFLVIKQYGAVCHRNNIVMEGTGIYRIGMLLEKHTGF